MKIKKECDNMLSNPQNGWVKFKLGKTTYNLSYLTDIPIDWLDQSINGLENMKPFVVYGYLEPNRVICVVSYWNIHVFIENDANLVLNPALASYEIIHINMIDFCNQLYEDIKVSFDYWLTWLPDIQERIKRKKELEKKLEKLKKLIEKRKNMFQENCSFT